MRKIEDNDVIIEDDDQKITKVTISGSTRYAGSHGTSAKIGDFQPGDHVTLSVKPEKNDTYRASKMELVREGTMDEHSAASQATDDISRPITKGSSSTASSSSSPSSSPSSSSSSGNSNPDRPVLRRAGSSSDDNISKSSSASSNDDNPDRPKLRRSPSSSGDSASSSSNSSGSSIPQSIDDDPDRPRLHRAVSSADSGAGATITPTTTPDSSATVSPRRSATPPPPPPSSSSSDDSDRPVLRRGQPATDSGTAVAAARPSIHADDANGVTRLPSAPTVGPPDEDKPSRGLQVPNRIASSGDDVIDKAREAAFSYSETLPNYVVKQFTTRYETQVARGGKTSWQALDEVTADVLEVDGVEQYKNILVNGKAPREDVSKTGSWSSGEFSSVLLDVLSPSTGADFHGKRTSTIANRPAFRYDFSVEQSNSHWHIESEGQNYMPAYTGSIWIDKETYRALRIELAAQTMPRSFPLDTVESAVDYDFVLIGDGKFLLPVHSEALSCGRGTSSCSRNVIEFRNYRKFSAETSITFDTDK